MGAYFNVVLFFVVYMFIYLSNVAHDINGYAKAPPSFRVWAGGTVEPSNIELLLPWLDWAYSEVKKSYA